MSDGYSATLPSPVVMTRLAYHHGTLRGQLIAAARNLVEAEGPHVQHRACRLRSFLHGHSVLHTGMKTKVTTAGIGDCAYLMVISRAAVTPAVRTHS